MRAGRPDTHVARDQRRYLERVGARAKREKARRARVRESQREAGSKDWNCSRREEGSRQIL